MVKTADEVMGLAKRFERRAIAYGVSRRLSNDPAVIQYDADQLFAARATLDTAVRAVFARLAEVERERDELRAAGAEYSELVGYCVHNLRTVGVTDVRALHQATERFDAALVAPPPPAGEKG